MTLSRELIDLIGRIHPEIFDILGGPGPLGPVALGSAAALNPQPLPPGGDGFRAGVLAGAEMVRLAHTSSRLDVSLTLDPDDWCPTPPRRPRIPPVPWPPVEWFEDPREDVEQRWLAEYTSGLLFALDASTDSWRAGAAAESVEKIRQIALENAGQLG